jgi:ABC-type branched-subunit amino acid transport system permease subunit
VSGISVSLQMVFAVIVGGLYVSLGPTVGAVIIILLAESCASVSAPRRSAGTIWFMACCWSCLLSSCPRVSRTLRI